MDLRSIAAIHLTAQVGLAQIDPLMPIWGTLLDKGIAIAVVTFIAWRLTKVTIPRIVEGFREERAIDRAEFAEREAWYRKRIEELEQRIEGH